ncbi:glucose-1-phosphate cytidylyltransferase [Chitinophaga pendula]|uniref:glucose-1-phosphate cytidylyltransferase n=1 Tax=Chitinophaga TaxID=79328 RepID=UPI000BAF5765|nr:MULTISPECIES: glucose-1-phosphate cytidylyltransferase [Chitinophaga]ASZ10108.1 glucose-1-phosphate cytidylyltransferase [Chitinophaga sp. MD30]UCJ06939.1 glucose-1-phosphate cytidylyltransferase [Chitinophaga pendula]
MYVVILAGGLGTRLSEETTIRPKPMVEIGEKPILWHIMKIYSSFGFNDFIICLGYKGYVIKEYFANLFLHQSDVTIDVSNNSMEVHNGPAEKWKITLVETGSDTLTGGRIKRIQRYVGDQPFMLTYGDGVGNINIPELLAFHQQQQKLCTVTAVQPSGRFGVLQINSASEVTSFHEKRAEDSGWINGGFFVCEPGIFDYIAGDQTIWEREPLERLAQEHQLSSFKHHGFWRPMDSLKDKQDLNERWNNNKAEWKIW